MKGESGAEQKIAAQSMQNYITEILKYNDSNHFLFVFPFSLLFCMSHCKIT